MSKLIKVIAMSTAFIASSALAGSGKAIVPHWTGNSGTNSHVFMSNISSHDVVVEVKFFDKDGNVLSPTAYNNLVSNSIIEAGETAYISITKSSWNYGYAVITWENQPGDDDAVALVAHGARNVINTSSSKSYYAIPINNGMPF